VTAPEAMPRPIRRLDEETVRRIAAGEVVERPASVVKELVENAIDAGATEVQVRLEGGGLEAIVVDDDGSGIRPDDLPLAIERYATSKLDRPEDLEIVVTLGFRGEALAAIGAVSRLRILSRPGGLGEAHGISLVAGQAAGLFVEGRSPGTTVEVRDLFFNTPARRKFLHAPAAEQLEVAATIERLYLARPAVGLTLANEHGEMLRLPASTSLADAAARVLGPEFLAASFPLRSGAGARFSFRGLLSRPALSRSNAQGLHLSVNGRVIQSRLLTQSVRQAYTDYLPRGRFPMGMVHLEIEPAAVDVNVHPTKREVRIARERDVADALRRAVRDALVATPHVADTPAAPAEPERMALGRARPAEDMLEGGDGDRIGVPTGAGTQTVLDRPEAAAAIAATGRHPALRLIGPIFDLYWLAESEGSLVLLDQHAASERVLFEQLRASGRLARQELVVPVRLELGARRAEVLALHADDVRRAGFEVEPFGANAYRILAVPSYRGRRVRAEQLLALLDEVGDGGRATVPDGIAERTDASIACHAAIRAGDVVAPEEIQRVVEALYALPEASYACPHGRPILIRFPRGRVDRWFLRSPE
jgi:DNA mismatch repair protein MutL